MLRSLLERAPYVFAAGVLGALAFVGVQELTGPGNIAAYMGAEIVERGGYPEGLAGVLGWGVHLGVSLGYAALFAAITALPAFPSARGPRLAVGLAVALGLGWVTTLVTSPAIATTISLLALQGLPESLPGLNTTLGVPFWNHIGFFLITFAVTVAARDRLAGVSAAPAPRLSEGLA